MCASTRAWQKTRGLRASVVLSIHDRLSACCASQVRPVANRSRPLIVLTLQVLGATVRAWARLIRTRQHASVAENPRSARLHGPEPSVLTVALLLCFAGTADAASLAPASSFEQWAACIQPPAGSYAAIVAAFWRPAPSSHVHRRRRVRPRALERAISARHLCLAAAARTTHAENSLSMP